MDQRRSLKELNLLDKSLTVNYYHREPLISTCQMKCEEIPELKLDDGATRIFLNTRGEHPELVPSELIELLKYMQHSTDEVSGACESKRIQEMHRRVCQIRASEKTEVKYMQTWEEKIQNEKAAEG